MSVRYRLISPIMMLIVGLLVAQILPAEQPILARGIRAAESAAADRDMSRRQSGEVTATATSTPGATNTPYPCPQVTPEPLWVEPVISPTGLLTQTITIFAGRALTVTVSSEAGVVAQTSGSTWPARITIDLLPQTTHHLTVKAHIAPHTTVNGCVYGGYTLQTLRDRYGSLLTIVQSGSATATPTGSPTVTPSSTPTPYPCPTGTPAPLWVEPVISPTGLLTQTITIYAGSALTVTVSSEAGVVAQTSGSTWPARITVDLLPQTTHHLTVQAQIPRLTVGGCVSGGYTLQTTRDKQGNLLTIVQSSGPTATPTLPPTPTTTIAVPLDKALIHLPVLLR
ncbi:MAG: hypothetical protein H0T53_15655 [Herpetosiphonaceae bacterium]|nr:hypothetical protein [Herpetosiphonaceae bacterium]